MSALRWFLPLLVVLFARPALAEESAELAARAATVHEEHCTEVRGGRNVQVRGKAIQAVAEVWTALDVAWTEAPEPYLRYWRGLLAQCLQDDETAVADLQAFVDENAEVSDYAAQVRDAKKRLRRLGVAAPRKAGRARPATVALGLLAPSLAGGAVAFGLGALAADEQEYQVQESLRMVVHPQDEVDALLADREQYELQSGGFGLVALAAGITSIALTGAAIASGVADRRASVGVVAVVAPQGALLVVGGSW